MAEKHGFEATDQGHRLCANNCGFLGSPATMNLCSKCYRDLRLKEEQDSLAKSALEDKSSSSPSRSSSSATASSSSSSVSIASTVNLPTAVKQAARPGRCLTCRKRVGLTGFKCRCGSMFCGSHRYPEEHGCAFDYKKAGKEEIARANPVVKAAKLDRI